MRGVAAKGDLLERAGCPVAFQRMLAHGFSDLRERSSDSTVPVFDHSVQTIASSL